MGAEGCGGRAIVIGKPLSRWAAISRSSQAILLREYSQYGFTSGVDSVITGCAGGFWYADAELMNTNWPVEAAWGPPPNQARLRSMCGTVNAIQSTTGSYRAPRSAAGGAPP